MEIEISQEKLAKALNNVSRVAAGARAALPILNNVLIRVDEGKVTLTTTNLDMAVVSYLPVTSSKNGVVTVPARLMAEFASNLPKKETVKIMAEDTKVTIKAGGYTSTINGASAEDYPELPEIDESKVVKFQMGAEVLKAGLSQVMIAATDGYRLAERKLVDKIEAEVTAIVPATSLQEVLRSLSDDVDEIEVLFDETQVRFRLGEMEITSKLVDGSFPDYRQLLPKETEIQVKLERDELVRVTKLAALFAKEVGGSVVGEAKAEEGVFTIASVANELGENSSEIKTEVNTDGKVTLNSRFLLDALNVLDGKDVEMGFSNRLDPVVLRVEKQENYVHIVMPLKG